jgi:hypothetical protein
MEPAVEGYEVTGTDDHKVGQVVAVEGDLLIVEAGMLRKTRHAIPMAFAHADDGERVVRLTISKDLVDDSPALKDHDVDRKAVMEHYGLAEGYEAPETQGLGELRPDDPASSAEQEGLRTGVEPAPERRARIREGESDAGVRGRPIIPPDSHDPL